MIPASGNFITANRANAKGIIYLLSIEGYARVFTNYETGVAGQYAWIEDMEDLEITVSDMDGGADLGTLSVTVQDHRGLITADFPTALFEGKKVTLKTGLVGMSQSDFATIFNGVIDSVDSANANQSYVFNCEGPDQVLSKVIFTTGDDGQPTDSDHPKTLNAHPLDILIDVLENQVGIPSTGINLSKIFAFRNGVYAGLQFTFSIDSPPSGKDFIEQQIMKPLGGYIWVNSKGQFDVNFFYGTTWLTRVDIPANAQPWSLDGGINSSFSYAPDSLGGDAISIPTIVGQTVTLTYLSGTISRQDGTFPYTDAAGDPSINGKTSGFPGFYVSGTCHAGSLVGTFADDLGQIVGSPFVVGNGGSFTPPAGSSQLLLGVNDANTWRDNVGSWLLKVTGAAVRRTVMDLTPNNTLEIPLAQTADLVNVISYRFDKNSDGKYMSESIQKYGASIARFGSVGDGQLYGQQIIESDGARSGLQGFFLAALVSRLIFLRYGLKNLYYDQVPLLWNCVQLEPGDLVTVTQPTVPDRENGVIGIIDRVMEVLDRSYNFREGIVTVKVLDATYLSSFGTYLIAPDGTPAFASASTDEKAKYMFMANNSDEYSTGAAAHVLG